MFASIASASRRARRALGRGLVLLAALPLMGCGYQQSGDWDHPSQSGYQWHSLYREDIQTVAVPIFTTRDYQRGLEFQLSKAVVNQLEAHTPYKVVPRDHADTVLEGEVINSYLSTLSRTLNNNLPQEQLYTVTINFVWKDLRTGQVLLDRRNFQQTATFYPTVGESNFIATQSAVERLALAIVQEMQADW